MEIERALHTAFGPNMINGSREFFQIEPEQIQVLLGVMPGRDVNPQTASQNADAQDEDQAAASEYKKRQARTNELEFMESLNEHGAVIYQRVLALGNHEGMRVKWATGAFSLNVVSNGILVPVCWGNPPRPLNFNRSGNPTPSPDLDALALWDDNGNGRITCGEARAHSIAPVHRRHPAYQHIRDADGDGVVCG